jgi:hypothetical protein
MSPRKAIRACPGGGTRILKKNMKRDPKYIGSNPREGWRATCPDCGKICAVGPISKAIVQHAPGKPVEPKLTKAETTNRLYETVYALGKAGEMARPDRSGATYKLNTWIMAYMDGLADGGHNMKLGAFKRWLTQHAIPY